MTNRIDFETKTDRELLILVAQMVNTINDYRLPAILKQLDDLNAIVDEHDTRLVKIETGFKPNNSLSSRKLSAIVAGITTGVCTSVYFLGKCLNWW